MNLTHAFAGVDHGGLVEASLSLVLSALGVLFPVESRPCFVGVPGACSGEKAALAVGKGEGVASLGDCTGDVDCHAD